MKNIFKLLSFEHIKANTIFFIASIFVLYLNQNLLQLPKAIPWMLVFCLGLFFTLKGPAKFWNEHILWSMSLPIKRTTIIIINYLSNFLGTAVFVSLICLLIFIFENDFYITVIKKIETNTIIISFFIFFFLFIHPFSFLIPPAYQTKKQNKVTIGIWICLAILFFVLLRFEIWRFSPNLVLFIFWTALSASMLQLSVWRLNIPKRTNFTSIISLILISALPFAIEYAFSLYDYSHGLLPEKAEAKANWGKLLPSPSKKELGLMLAQNDKQISYTFGSWRKQLLISTLGKEKLNIIQDNFFNLEFAFKMQSKDFWSSPCQTGPSSRPLIHA